MLSVLRILSGVERRQRPAREAQQLMAVARMLADSPRTLRVKSNPINTSTTSSHCTFTGPGTRRSEEGRISVAINGYSAYRDVHGRVLDGPDTQGGKARAH